MKKVLVVEDKMEAREVLVRLLKEIDEVQLFIQRRTRMRHTVSL